MKRLFRKFQNKLQNEGPLSALKASLRYFKNATNQGIEEFSFTKNLNIREDIERKYNFSGALLDIFVANKDNVVHKWHHYIPLYDKYFSNFRNRQVRFLEIGVSKGGSLQMWRKYFGEDAIIFGIDIDPECEKYNGLGGQVRIGS